MSWTLDKEDHHLLISSLDPLFTIRMDFHRLLSYIDSQLDNLLIPEGVSREFLVCTVLLPRLLPAPRYICTMFVPLPSRDTRPY